MHIDKNIFDSDCTYPVDGRKEKRYKMSKAEVTTNESINNELNTRSLKDVDTNGDFFVNLMQKNDVKEDELTYAKEVMLALHTTHTQMSKGYYEMCGHIAKLISCKAWENFYDCRNINELIYATIGCSPSTASELASVARMFYNSNGTKIAKYDGYAYSVLKVLATLKSQEEVDSAITLLEQLPHVTRDHVTALVKYIKKGKDTTLLIVDKDKNLFTVKAEDKTENKAEDKTENKTENKAEDKTENKAEDNSTGEKSSPVGVSTNTQRIKAIDIFNDATELRKKIDSMSKTDIKKAIDKLIIDLGELSK